MRRSRVVLLIVILSLSTRQTWSQNYQDPLPAGNKFSSVLQTQNIQTTPASQETKGQSLWDIMKDNFFLGYTPRPTESPQENNVYATIPRLTSALEWAGNETKRQNRDAPWVDTLRLMGTVGQSLVTLWNPTNTISPISTLQHTTTTGSRAGWGWTGGQTEVVVHRVTLLERLINAQLAIARTFLLGTIGSVGALTSSLPLIINYKFRVLNVLLSVVARFNVGAVLRSIWIINRAVIKGQVNFLCALLGIPYPFRQTATVLSLPAPVVEPVHVVTPSSAYGPPGYQHGEPIGPSIPDYSYSSSRQVLTKSVDSTKSHQSYEQPLTDSYSVRNNKNPLNAYPQYGNEESSFPLLPPVVSQPVVGPSESSDSSESVVVPANFLRQLMQQSASSFRKFSLSGETHSHSPRSTATSGVTLDDNKNENETKTSGRFSSVLLKDSGFSSI